jgi:hypothetical protein
VDILSQLFLDICDVLLPAQQTLDVLSQDFFDSFAVSSRLFTEMWTFVTPFSGYLWCPATCSANCGCFVTGSMKKYWWHCQMEKSKKSCSWLQISPHLTANQYAPDCKSVVLGSNPAPPLHTANSVSPEVGSHLGWHSTVCWPHRGSRGTPYTHKPLKIYRKK